jgi:hypothetical protein
VVDQNATHHHHRESDELRPIPPIDTLLINQSQVCFVNQRCGLKRVIGTLRSQIAGSQAVELGIHNL